MKKIFEEPEFKVIEFNAVDVITASKPGSSIIPGDDELPITPVWQI